MGELDVEVIRTENDGFPASAIARSRRENTKLLPGLSLRRLPRSNDLVLKLGDMLIWNVRPDV